jgi:hypothetical protein
MFRFVGVVGCDALASEILLLEGPLGEELIPLDTPLLLTAAAKAPELAPNISDDSNVANV